MRPFTLISIVFLSLVAAAHLTRMLLGLDVRVGGWVVPAWASLVAFLFTGSLAGLLTWEQRRD